MTRPFQMKFNWENVLPGVSQPSADLQAQRSSLAQAARPTGHRSQMRETEADATDDEGLRVRALGPSDNPPEGLSRLADLCFWNSIIFVAIKAIASRCHPAHQAMSGSARVTGHAASYWMNRPFPWQGMALRIRRT
jgi:hypothetical protein